MGLNDWFTQHYRKQRQSLERALQIGEPPLFIRLGDALVGYIDHRRRSHVVRDATYHRLKAEAHVPVALYLLFAPLAKQERWPVQELDALQHELREASAHTDDEGPLAASRMWLEGVLREGRLDAGALARLEEQTRKGILEHIDRAAQREMHAMHESVQAWTQGWSRQDWERALVVVCAGSQPRYRQSSLQYFERLLRVTPAHKAGARRSPVLYEENCRSEEEAIVKVASHLLDRQLGEAFLNSPLAMQQDLLADAAERALDALGLPRVAAEGEQAAG